LANEHISVSAVKSYLLGTLDERSADALEDRYFSDRSFFNWVRAEETKLIQEHISGRLKGKSRELFEKRYFTIPDLRKRYDEVKTLTDLEPVPHAWFLSLKFQLAAAALICAGLASWWFSPRALRPSGLPEPAALPTVVATLTLQPGVLKAEENPAARLAPPDRPGDVLFNLESPEQSVTACKARLLRLAADGTWQSIWTTPQKVSPGPGGQTLPVKVPGALLIRGEYRLELFGNNEDARKDYYRFRVSPL
jgi:hypothetical protein